MLATRIGDQGHGTGLVVAEWSVFDTATRVLEMKNGHKKCLAEYDTSLEVFS